VLICLKISTIWNLLLLQSLELRQSKIENPKLKIVI